ncbi:UNVERIFIED_CONTAM: TITAN-like protein [Sesamum angustifolium]|uniref:TITAN-like protein n=1 Tax=Sesamum angustifolium TaxID=2727405 RepID=A0AAW2Q9L4_9LAMI
MNQKKKKKNSNEQQQFEYCEVCRVNHNQGRRHNYFPNHKTSLATLLTRFQSKLSDVKFFVKTPMLLHPDHAHQNRLWCPFCNCDVLELDSHFACDNAIEHLASVEHWKSVKDLCGSTEAEWTASTCFVFLRWITPSYTNERAQVSGSVLSSVSEAGPSLHNMSGGIQGRDAEYLKNSTDYMENCPCSNSLASECSSYGYLASGSVYPGVRIANGEDISLGNFLICLVFFEFLVFIYLLNVVVPVFICLSVFCTGFPKLTQISSTSQEGIEGNVHSGAPPPWFDGTKGNQPDLARKPELKGHVSSKAGKSSKLNPKRVGAAWAERRKLELELERKGGHVNNNFDANWLPNFGRVWQSGTRKESRKEFQTENKATHKADHQSEMLMPLQPYISKRMVRFAYQGLFIFISSSRCA